MGKDLEPASIADIAWGIAATIVDPMITDRSPSSPPPAWWFEILADELGTQPTDAQREALVSAVADQLDKLRNKGA